MAFKDNREFVAKLEKSRDAVRIKKEVDWDVEAGAIVRRVCEMQGPAPFFEKVKDYPPGYRIFGAPLATNRRIAIALGLDPATPRKLVRDEYEQRLQNPVKPIVVKNAPCKENVLRGKDVDLFRFPAPMIHYGDGGRYMGTWHAIICRDPETDWTNWGMYRLMILNQRHLVGTCAPYSHQWAIWQRAYVSKNQNMPVAIAIGLDPASSMVSCGRSFGSRNEADYAGALRQEPVELVKCETNDLLVPAHAEIVLEGELLTGEWADEGPFGEYPGYRSGVRSPDALYRISAITHRNDPVLTMTCVGMPVEEDHIFRTLDHELIIKRLLRMHRVPFTDVHMPAEAASFAAIVGVKRTYAGIATQIGNILGAAQLDGGKKVIVVDGDVDVFNLAEVFHAFATKCHPVRGIRIYDKEPEPSVLTPFISPEERKWLQTARVVIDCTWPVEWNKQTEVPPRITFNETYPKEVKEKVIQNWEDYGFQPTQSSSAKEGKKA